MIILVLKSFFFVKFSSSPKKRKIQIKRNWALSWDRPSKNTKRKSFFSSVCVCVWFIGICFYYIFRPSDIHCDVRWSRIRVWHLLLNIFFCWSDDVNFHRILDLQLIKHQFHSITFREIWVFKFISREKRRRKNCLT